jgi:hypothetical protein
MVAQRTQTPSQDEGQWRFTCENPEFGEGEEGIARIDGLYFLKIQEGAASTCKNKKILGGRGEREVLAAITRQRTWVR